MGRDRGRKGRRSRIRSLGLCVRRKKDVSYQEKTEKIKPRDGWSCSENQGRRQVRSRPESISSGRMRGSARQERLYPSARTSLSGTVMVGSDQRRQDRMGSAARVQMLRPLLQVRSCLWFQLRKTIKILRTCEPMGPGHWTSHSRRWRSRKGSEHRRCMAWRQPGIQAPEAQGGGTLQCGHVAELRDIGVWHQGWLTQQKLYGEGTLE